MSRGKGSTAVLVGRIGPDVEGVPRAALREAGFEVREVGGGREALHLLAGAGEVPALLVLDPGAPGSDDWELLEILRSYNRLGRIPVVVLSSDGAFPVGGEGGGQGVVVLKRPVGRETLLRAITVLLGV